MSTILQIIDDALREINVIDEVQSASAEQGKFALRKLNQMMALLRETKDFDLGYFTQTTTTGTMPTPEWADLAITLALGIACASKYGASVSIELAATAESAMSGVQTKLQVEKKKGVDLSYLPVGSGHYGRGNNILTDT
jgi:hypothetical protein